MQVGVKDPVVQRLGQEGPEKVDRQLRPVEPGQLQGGGVGQGRAGRPFQGQDLLADAFPDDGRGGHVAIPRHHLAQLVAAGGLQAQVELQLGGADHGLGEGPGLQPPGGGHIAIHQKGGLGQSCGVLGHPDPDVRAQDLDRHPAAVPQAGVMGLGQGGGGHGLAELGKQGLDRRPQGGLHLGPGDLGREGRQPVFQPRQVLGELRPEDVGPGGHELAKLDGHRPQLDQGPGQPLAGPADLRLLAGQEPQGPPQIADRRRIEGLQLGGQQGVVTGQGPGGGEEPAIGGGSRHVRWPSPDAGPPPRR